MQGSIFHREKSAQLNWLIDESESRGNRFEVDLRYHLCVWEDWGHSD